MKISASWLLGRVWFVVLSAFPFTHSSQFNSSLHQTLLHTRIGSGMTVKKWFKVVKSQSHSSTNMETLWTR